MTPEFPERKSRKTGYETTCKHIFLEGELDERATCRKIRQVQKEGNRNVERELPFYNLDLIISLGYRIKSKIATQFRIWATERLKEYIVKGFVMDDERLKNLGGGGYRRRWKIERTMAWTQNFRRLVVRYDRYIAMFNAQIQIACTIIAINRL